MIVIPDAEKNLEQCLTSVTSKQKELIEAIMRNGNELKQYDDDHMEHYQVVFPAGYAESKKIFDISKDHNENKYFMEIIIDNKTTRSLETTPQLFNAVVAAFDVMAEKNELDKNKHVDEAIDEFLSPGM